jgi:hypothetical protein
MCSDKLIQPKENEIITQAFGNNVIKLSDYFKNEGDAFCDFESC